MTESDLDEVLDIERASFPNPWSRGQFESEFNNPLASAYTARLCPPAPPVPTDSPGSDGEIAAYMVFWVVHGEAHILNIVVAQALRRRGLATELLKYALNEMRTVMVFEVFLEVRRSNAAARELYKKFGFTETFVRKNYYGDEDAIVMSFRY